MPQAAKVILGAGLSDLLFIGRGQPAVHYAPKGCPWPR